MVSEEKRIERKVFGVCDPDQVTEVTLNGVDWIGLVEGSGEVNGRGRNILIAEPRLSEASERIAIPLGRLRAIRFTEASR